MAKHKKGKLVLGRGFFSDLWSGIKKVGETIVPILKKTGAISKIAAATGNPVASGVASSLGFGKKRRRKTGMGKKVIKM